jgi:hypothetical protein
MPISQSPLQETSRDVWPGADRGRGGRTAGGCHRLGRLPRCATWTPTKPAPPGRAAPFATRCGYGRTRRRPPPTSFLWSALPRPLCRANGTKLGSLELTGELNRRGETTVRELLEVLEPTRRSAGQRAVLWLLRVGLAVAA